MRYYRRRCVLRSINDSFMRNKIIKYYLNAISRLNEIPETEIIKYVFLALPKASERKFINEIQRFGIRTKKQNKWEIF